MAKWRFDSKKKYLWTTGEGMLDMKRSTGAIKAVYTAIVKQHVPFWSGRAAITTLYTKFDIWQKRRDLTSDPARVSLFDLICPDLPTLWP